MDTSKLSLDELQALRLQIDRELTARKELRRNETLSQLRTVAKKAGFSLEELVRETKKKTRPSAPVKYRDPANPSNTWAGRGRKPKWLEAALKRGEMIESFAV